MIAPFPFELDSKSYQIIRSDIPVMCRGRYIQTANKWLIRDSDYMDYGILVVKRNDS